VALLSAINGQAVTGIGDKMIKEAVEHAAKALLAAKGSALVVCGSNDVNIQLVVNAINQAIGAVGTTINWGVAFNGRKGVDADMAKLVEDMKAGSVGTLLIQGANPAYTWPQAAAFTEALKKVKTSISFSSKLDETAVACKYVIPDHHFLESWGDAEAKTGYVSFMQPTIYPLFKTRQWQDSLLKWSGNASDYLAFLKTSWSAKLGGVDGWDKALQDGVLASTPAAFNAGSFSSAAVANAVTAATSTTPIPDGSNSAM
jgi:molybdopterin-containing oxidoreductase family iron-sulfur binding subunit